MKRIGLLSLALVLALGTLGVGYAAWYQTVEITQTVETARLDVGVWGEGKIWFDGKDIASIDVELGPEKFTKVCEYGGTYHEYVIITIEDMYPCIEVRETFKFGVADYSIPVKVMVDIDMRGDVWDCLDFAYEIHGKVEGKVITPIIGAGRAADVVGEIEECLEGLQMHGCDYIVVFLVKTRPQFCDDDEQSQGLSGTIKITLTGIQYNKYVAP